MRVQSRLVLGQTIVSFSSSSVRSTVLLNFIADCARFCHVTIVVQVYCIEGLWCQLADLQLNLQCALTLIVIASAEQCYRSIALLVHFLVEYENAYPF